MDKLFFRLFLVVILALLSFVYSFPRNAYNINVPFTWNDYKLWLDLQWWIELDYKVDLEEVQKSSDYTVAKENSIIEWLKSIIDKRVETLKINDSVITTASYAWEKHIIVQIPLKWSTKDQDELNIKRAKEAIWKVMKIEFRQRRESITEEDLKARKDIADKLLNEAISSKYDFVVTKTKYKDNEENVSIWSFSWSNKELSNFLTLSWSELKTWLYNKVLFWTWINSTTNTTIEDNWYYVIDIKNINDTNINFDYAYISSKPSEWIAAKDSKWRILNDKYFINSSVQQNEAFQIMIELVFNDEWAKIFWELTQKLVWKQIAIFVWWEMLTAPNVNEPILSGKAVITWNYTRESANKLSNDINTWVVPAPIYLTSEKAIDSRLWLNSLQELIYAWIIWFIAICLFLVITYRISWVISSIALFIYVLIFLSIVKMFWIVLTLAWIAGMILSVWMAIDANILIFERVKDELKRWNKLKKAVVEWFDRSWSAIWDSNVTGLIIALILYVFWVNLIKWFWLMLWIWIMLSMFSAMFLTRLFLLLIIKKEKLSVKSLFWYKE